MIDDDSGAELRRLQAKAYGRAGGLTAHETERLRKLQGAVLADPVPAPGPADPATTSAQTQEVNSPPDEEPTRTLPGDDAGVVTEPRSENTAERVRLMPRHPRWVAAAAVVGAVVGIGLGWGIFAPHHRDAVELTAAEQQQRQDLYEDSYRFDEGSIIAAGREGDALAWTATRGNGDEQCLIVAEAEDHKVACAEASFLAQVGGLYAQLDLPRDEGNDVQRSVSGALHIGLDGRPAVTLQRWDGTFDDFAAQIPAGDREIARGLVNNGFDFSVALVGYDGDVPIWRGTRMVNNTPEDCLIYDPAGGLDSAKLVCADVTETFSEGSSYERRRIAALTLPATAESPRSREVILEQSGWNSYIVIRDIPEADDEVAEMSFDDLVTEFSPTGGGG